MVTILALLLAPNALATDFEEGVKPDAFDGPSRIIHGEAAELSDHPESGALLGHLEATGFGQRFEVRTFICSSTLIAPDVVLAAAHCVDPDTLNYMMTQGTGTLENSTFRWSQQADLSNFAAQDLQIRPWPDGSVPVREVVWHEDFVGAARMGLGLSPNHDISLIFLDAPVLDTEHAYLPTADEIADIVVDAQVTVVGWGQQVATGPGEAPAPGDYGIKQIGDSFINEIGTTEIQIGEIETDVRKCHGDSGGPSFLDVTTDSPVSTRVIGVTSHIYDYTDCNSKGTVDTRVDHYLEWIDAQMRARCGDEPTRAWCEVPGIVPPPEPEPLDDGRTEAEDEKGGCGCSATPGWTGGLWTLALAGLIRRRR